MLTPTEYQCWSIKSGALPLSSSGLEEVVLKYPEWMNELCVQKSKVSESEEVQNEWAFEVTQCSFTMLKLTVVALQTKHVTE